MDMTTNTTTTCTIEALSTTESGANDARNGGAFQRGMSSFKAAYQRNQRQQESDNAGGGCCWSCIEPFTRTGMRCCCCATWTCPCWFPLALTGIFVAAAGLIATCGCGCACCFAPCREKDWDEKQLDKAATCATACCPCCLPPDDFEWK